MPLFKSSNPFGNDDQGYLNWDTYVFKRAFLCDKHEPIFNANSDCKKLSNGDWCNQVDVDIYYWPCASCFIMSMNFYRYCAACRTASGPKTPDRSSREQPPHPRGASGRSTPPRPPPPYEPLDPSGRSGSQQPRSQPSSSSSGAQLQELAKQLNIQSTDASRWVLRLCRSYAGRVNPETRASLINMQNCNLSKDVC